MYEGYLEDESECVGICETYANIQAVGCTFAAWIKGQVYLLSLSQLTD